MKPLLNEYFEYTRAERRGVSLLILLCGFVWLFPYLFPLVFPKSSTDFSNFDSDIASFEESQHTIPKIDQDISSELFAFNPNTVNKTELLQLGISEKVAQTLINYRSKIGLFKNKSDLKKIYGLNEEIYQRLEPYIELDTYKKETSPNVQKEETSAPILFVFDPNSASAEDLKRLGLASKTVQNILKYRAANGKFYRKEDLQKIYTLSQKEYDRLKDYVEIASLKSSPAIAQNAELTTSENDIPTSYDALVQPKVVIDINKATQEEWQQLRGIGATYAARIVKFRESLGGFSSIDQVADTYNLPDSTFQSIQLSLRPSPIFRTISVNEMDAASLKSHPYLNWKTANMLVNYREQHGSFKNLEDLKNMKGLSEETLRKLAPYLKF